MNPAEMKPPCGPGDGQPLARLLDAVQRLQGQRQAKDIANALVDEAAALCGTQRVLLALDSAQGLQAAAMRLPPGEEAAALLSAVTPWLIEARRSRKARLRHGPAGADPRDQRSCLVVPLVVPGGTLGLLYADIDGARGRFDAGHQRVLGRLGAAAAAMLDNALWAQGLERKVAERTAELREALERQTATAEILRVISSSPTDLQPVMDAVGAYAARLCEAHNADIFKVEGEVVRLVARHGTVTTSLRVGEARAITRGSVSGRAILERAPVHLHDAREELETAFPDIREAVLREGIRTMLAIPLLREGQPIGAITIFRTEVRPFTAQQIQLLQTFADQAVIAIENVRLFNETREALEQQTATAEVLQAISNSIADATPVFERILASAKRLIASEGAALFLMPGDGLFHCAAVLGSSADAVKALFPVPLAQSSAPMLMAKRRQICYLDAAQDANVPASLRRAAAASVAGSYSIVLTPLLWQGEVIGILNSTRPTGVAFNDKELGLLRSFADQAVIAVQNARLFRETNEALERQTATAEILKVIASSPDSVQPVFDAIAASSKRLLDGYSTMVTRIFDDALHLVAFTSTNPEGDAALRVVPGGAQNLG